MLSIRIAGKQDAGLVADISRQTFIETFASVNSKEDMDKFLNDSFSKEKLMHEVGAPGNIFLLAYKDENPVGYVRIREDNNPPELAGSKSIEIARLYAVHSSIGKGVGTQLMKECIRIAVEKKNEIIWLGVWEKNKRAIDFYIKWGFQKFSSHVFKLGDDNQTDWLMKKMLD